MTREEILARLEEIREEAEALDEELRTLSDAEELSEDEEARFGVLMGDDGESPFVELKKEKEKLNKRLQILDARDDLQEPGSDRGAPQYMERTETTLDNVNEASRAEVRAAALATIEKDETGLSDEARAKVEREIRSVRLDRDGQVMYDGDAVARRLLITERDAYKTAFQKTVRFSNPAFEQDEVRAINELRAGPQSLTDVSGGYGVPVLIDPTIIMTTGASDTPILRVARIETITTDVWKGVSSAPASWSFDGEGTEVSDDSLTLAQPSVTTYMTRAFIPYTIEIGQDYPNFANEMRRALSEGYIQQIASQTMTGSGSAPQGIFTAIDANAAREQVVTTSGSLSPQDVFTAWENLGELWRSRASWFSSVTVESQVRKANNNNHGLYSVDLTAEGLVVVNGRPWYKTDYAPAFTGTTGTVNLLVVGDFSNYLIAQRAGMTVENVPHLFGITNARPLGQRGLFAHARWGADSVNDNAFTLLKNAT